MAVFIICFYYMIPATNDLVCEWKVKWCRTQVQNPISVFQIKKKSEEFNSDTCQRLGGTLYNILFCTMASIQVWQCFCLNHMNHVVHLH
jgi:hypothetical protein